VGPKDDIWVIDVTPALRSSHPAHELDSVAPRKMLGRMMGVCAAHHSVMARPHAAECRTSHPPPVL
jgi:hypothetical protein